LKKKFFFLFCFISIDVFSQASLEKREVQLNAGIGASAQGIPLHVGLDYGVGSNISIGTDASFRTFKNFGYSNGNRSTIINFGVNGNYYFTRTLDVPSNIEYYAGLGVGYFIWYDDESDIEVADDNFVGIGFQVGGRFFLNRNYAVYLELVSGPTLSGLKIGITHTKL
jgi:outer membrane immunogenic protein